MAKPKFDPSQKFEKLSPKFDPSAAFETIEDPSILESGLRGAAQGLTFGLADEATGALEAAFSDKSYEQARDESRQAYKEAETANPTAYLTGDIGGSIATSFIPGLGALNAGKGAKLAEVAGKAALQGGLTGFGKSEAADVSGLLKDTATGAAVGGALGSAAYGVGRGIAQGSELWDAVGGKEGLKQAAQAFKEGAKEGKDLGGVDISSVPGVSQLSQAYYGGKRAISELAGLASTKQEMGDVAAALQKTFGPGSATDLSNNDILMQKLLEEGIAGEPNGAHRLVASKFAQAHGGDANQYLALIKRSPEELAAAQSFNPIAAAEELAPSTDDAFQSVRKAAGKQYDALKNQARAQFPAQGTSPVKVLSDAIEGANKYKSISGNTRAILDDAFEDLAGREGEKAFTQLTPEEQFDRILGVKQRLGKGVKWASKNELPEGQQLLADTYTKFQGLTQSLDDMAAADKGYSGFKSLENNLFKKLGTVERGRIKEFNPIKLEKLFSGSASGRSLMAQVQKAKDMLEQGILPPESAASVQQLLDKIDEMAAKASLKREMGAFRYGDAGPSSPAVQRMQAVAGKNSAVTAAVQTPQLFLKMKAAAEPAAQSIYGKSFGKLSPQEKSVVSRYALWISQNEGASDVDIKRKLASLMQSR